MSRKLLLADDSITIQKVIQITFAHEDYQLTVTDNGDAALAKVRDVQPDLVMADVYMPGKNGYELAAAIKEDAALQHIPVLLLAGSFEPFDEEKAKSCQADAWIEKPFESQTLIDKVNELLSAAPEPAQPAPAAPEAAPTAPSPEPEPAPVAPAPAPEAAPAAPQPAAEAEGTVETGSEPEPVAAPTPTEADPFADISFDEEPLAEEPAPAAPDDDWGDMADFAEDTPQQPAAEEESFSFTDEDDAELPAMEDDFVFAEEPAADQDPFAESDFGETEDLDEVMPLDDDDILGAEDLEPAPEEQTLASWSRDAADSDDVFGDAAAESEAGEVDDFAAEPLEDSTTEPVEDDLLSTEEPAPAEEPAAADQPMAVETESVADFGTEFAAPAAGEAAAEPGAAAEPAEVAAAIEDVEQRAAGLSDAELEAIVEKVTAKVIEKLAETVLERVAWEVVPDLAESLIREEIRKIKEQAA